MCTSTFSIGKQIVWSIFAFSNRLWEIIDFSITLSIILEGFEYVFFSIFRASILGCIFIRILSVFRPKMEPKSYPKSDQNPSKMSYFSRQASVWWVWHVLASIWYPFNALLMALGYLFGPNLVPFWCAFADLGLPFWCHFMAFAPSWYFKDPLGIPSTF